MERRKNMISVDLSSLFFDQIEEMVKGIDEVTSNMSRYYEYRENHIFNEFLFEDLYEDICEVLNCWVGKTSIGRKKEKILELSFQNFFINFTKLLIYFKNNALASNEEGELSNKCLFRGKAYRYLGHNESQGKNKKIKPIYNEIYVSWSKLNKIPYIESKLRGWMTLISCEIEEPFYGIDLDALDISRPHEKEVVFPTIEKLISDIKYIK